MNLLKVKMGKVAGAGAVAGNTGNEAKQLQRNTGNSISKDPLHDSCAALLEHAKLDAKLANLRNYATRLMQAQLRAEHLLAPRLALLEKVYALLCKCKGEVDRADMIEYAKEARKLLHLTLLPPRSTLSSSFAQKAAAEAGKMDDSQLREKISFLSAFLPRASNALGKYESAINGARKELDAAFGVYTHSEWTDEQYADCSPEFEKNLSQAILAIMGSGVRLPVQTQ